MSTKQPPKKRISLPLNITLHPDVKRTLDALASEDRTSKGKIISSLILREKNRRTLK